MFKVDPCTSLWAIDMLKEHGWQLVYENHDVVLDRPEPIKELGKPRKLNSVKTYKKEKPVEMIEVELNPPVP